MALSFVGFLQLDGANLRPSSRRLWNKPLRFLRAVFLRNGKFHRPSAALLKKFGAAQHGMTMIPEKSTRKLSAFAAAVENIHHGHGQ